MRSAGRLALAFALLLAGCDGGEAGADAGPDGSPDAAFFPDATVTLDIPWLADGVPPVAPPAPPTLTPCPDGWREVPPEVPDGVATCEAYPEGGALECPTGEAHFPGEPGCVPIGSDCPVGDYAEGLADDGSVIFVDPYVAAGGDGTRARPLRRIADAMALASSGMTVALSGGEFDGTFEVGAGVTLRGKCVSYSFIGASSGLAIATVTGPGAALVDLTLANSILPGLDVTGPDASASLDGVLVVGVGQVGIAVRDGATLTGRSLLVRTTHANPVSGVLGRGLQVIGGGSAILSRVVFADNRDTAVIAGQPGSRIQLTDVAIRDTHVRTSDGLGGHALVAADGGTVELLRADLARNHDVAAASLDAGSNVTLADVVIRDTLAAADETGGGAVQVTSGAAAEIRRVLIRDNLFAGVLAADGGSSLSISDVVIRDTRPAEASLEYGRGIEVEDGVSAEIARALLSGNHEVGLFVGGAAARVDVSDLSVRDMSSRPSDGAGGAAVVVALGGSLGGARVRIERSREVGLGVEGEGSSADLEDVLIRDTLGRADGSFGRALNVQFAGSAQITRALFERSRDTGVLAVGEGSTIELADVAVIDTEPRGCASSTCAAQPAGFGLSSVFGASVSLTRFVLARADLCGIQIALDGEVDLTTGVVAENTIGVCLQVPGYDPGRLTGDVLYRDNETTVESTDYAVPEASDPIGGP